MPSDSSSMPNIFSGTDQNSVLPYPPHLTLDDSLALTIPGGVTVMAPNDLSLMTPYILMEQEDWFEDEIHFVRRLAEPGMAAIDIGANYGVYTLTLAKLAGPEGRIWAFEPAGKTAGFLQQSLTANGFGHVELICAALSDHVGQAALAVNANAELNTLHGAATASSETVSLTTLDACEGHWSGREIAFVKLDAEGEEANVIRGGERFFVAQSPLVMFEIKHGLSFNLDLADRFISLGYSIYRLIPGLGMLVPFQRSELIDPFQLNLFAAKSDRANFLAARGLLVKAAGAPPEPASMLWHTRLAGQAWAAGILPNWAHHQDADGPPEWLLHRAALNAFAQSETDDLTPTERMAALQLAFDRTVHAVQAAANFPRLCSLARIAAAIGQRACAVDALQRLMAMLRTGGTFSLDEPFLPVDSRSETLTPGNRLSDWMIVSIYETIERLGAYSSYFVPERSRALLSSVVNRPFHSLQAERRMELLNRRFPAKPQPQPNSPPAAGSTSTPDYNDWPARIRLALACRDCDHLERVEGAGSIVDHKGVPVQIMHNGIKVLKDGYYNQHLTEIIRGLRGCHEPQEELVFHEVLKYIPSKAVMIELGSYWCFYSLWFNKVIPDAVNHMIEPIPQNIRIGMENFRLNDAMGNFTQAFVSNRPHCYAQVVEQDIKIYIPHISVDQYLELHNIPYVHMLHSDIQGAELAMLDGGRKAIEAGKIGYIFISTHSDDRLHAPCIDFLKSNGFKIIAAHTMRESFSFDGLIVARAAHVQGPDEVVISKRI